MYSPLEQYKIIHILTIPYFNLDISVTIFTLIVIFLMLFLVSFTYFFFFSKFSTKIFSLHLFYNMENLITFTYSLTSSILPKEGLKVFPIIFIPFVFILTCNIIGLIPYSYTLTSQLYITGILALTYTIGTIINGFKKYQFKFFLTFLPPNTSFGLSFLIIPIEFVSYCFRPLSLSVRLFANMMAGHALLKVIVSFTWKLILIGSLLSGAFALGLLLALFFLEFAVACIQAYVFTMLILLYIKEIYSLSH